MPAQKLPDAVSIIYDAVAPRLGGEKALILGMSGAQGSGKTTVARALADAASANGLNAAAISLDDFYLTKAERARLAVDVHPLFETRGPPGTHDVDLAIAVLDAVHAGRATEAPSFDKSADDRRPAAKNIRLPANLDLLIFEGWCLGAAAQSELALATPMNDLERESDADGVWRRAVYKKLAGAYQELFSRIDFLAYLRAPDFNIVRDWRLEQERTLAALSDSTKKFMDAAAISFFIQHYERITRAMLETTPKRADLTLELDRTRRVTQIRRQ